MYAAYSMPCIDHVKLIRAHRVLEIFTDLLEGRGSELSGRKLSTILKCRPYHEMKIPHPVTRSPSPSILSIRQWLPLFGWAFLWGCQWSLEAVLLSHYPLRLRAPKERARRERSHSLIFAVSILRPAVERAMAVSSRVFRVPSFLQATREYVKWGWYQHHWYQRENMWNGESTMAFHSSIRRESMRNRESHSLAFTH